MATITTDNVQNAEEICDNTAAKGECAAAEANGKQENGAKCSPVKGQQQPTEKLSPSKTKISAAAGDAVVKHADVDKEQPVAVASATDGDHQNGSDKEAVAAAAAEKNGAAPAEEKKAAKNGSPEKTTTASPEKKGSPSKGQLKKPLEQASDEVTEDAPETKKARRSLEEKCDKTLESSKCDDTKEEKNGETVASN